MTCNDFLSRHTEWYDGLMEPPAADPMRAHAALCASCARYDRVVRRGAELARQLLPPVEVSDDFEPRLRHRLFHERDALARRRSGSQSVYAIAASILLVTAGAGIFAVAASRTPVVEGSVMFAAAPRAISPIDSNAFAVASAPVLERAASRTQEVVAPIEAESKGHDPHIASPTDWPVYSRGAVAVAFPASQAAVVVRPADFRERAVRASLVPLLIRH